MSEFVAYLHEVFVELGSISSRKMFGGYGIYHNDIMFGLVADDELYLKTDANTIQEFEALDLDAFEFVKDGKPMQMSYSRAPEEIFEDPMVAAHWANLALDAALRAKRK